MELDHMLFSDEDRLHLSGYVKSQSTRISPSNNSRALHKLSRNLQNLDVCVRYRHRTLSPCFFDTILNSEERVNIVHRSFNH